jgi:polyphenol oxidase
MASNFLTSRLLDSIPGLTHGFGQRIAGPRATARDVVREAFRESGDVFFLRQVHGCRTAMPPWDEPPDADASFTDRARTLLAIETADCLPVLIVDPINRRVAAAHAGWRGTVARVSQQAVRALVSQGSRAADLMAALGPSIGPCCYEVGRDVIDAFGAGGTAFLAGDGEKQMLNVAAANRTQLLAVGLRPAAIDHVDLCTRCRGDLFFSYRRDGANAGRMISVIGFSN